MNALVSTIEKNTGERFMSSAHGFFSLGGFIGAGIGSILISIFSAPHWHMLLVTSCILISNMLLSGIYSGIHEEEVDRGGRNNILKNISPLLGLAIVAFIIMFNEGAVEHWSNLLLHDVIHINESKSGLGFIAFSLSMTIGRFMGDDISERIGTVRLISLGCVIAMVAYFMVISAQFYITVAGFGILGLGLSVVIPEVFRLAGSTKGVAASEGISIVSGIGFAGFLIGPVLLGFISEWTSLIGSYVFLLSLMTLALVLTYFRLSKSYDRQ